MRKVFNFSAGPGMLPEEVLMQAQTEMLDWLDTGMSVMEVGHRGPEFKTIVEQSEADLRELMSIPEDYQVLFVAGGASTQFAMVPLNLFCGKKNADYVDTGIWSKKALEEAKNYGQVNIAAKIEGHHSLVSIPSQEKWRLDPSACYVHYTPNETIEGVEFFWIPETKDVPLVADMTSFILSKPIDITRFGVVYAGAQKNLGQAGLTVVIIRNDLVGKPLVGTPTLYSYKTYAENKSLYNTPPTYAWYIMSLVLAWVKRQGGLQVLAKINQRKSEKLYNMIDCSGGFYVNNVDPTCRSITNIPFDLHNPALAQVFLDQATEAGLTNLKGHRLVGGMRASIYNAMPEEGVDRLIEFMKDFVKRNG